MSLDDSPIVWAICTILVVAFVYKLILDHTRDIPLEYLESQSVVDSTRENNESAIYKSTKLDYSSGLRVGLGIRYDHYKLRNGNLCDVWEIMLRCLRSDDQRVIRVGKNTVKVSHLNFQVDKLAQFLHHVDEVCVVSSKFIASAPVLAITIACFVSNTTLHVYGDGLLEPKGMVVEEEHGEFYLSIGTKKTSVTSIVGEVREKTTFENVYTPKKDKGIALRVTSPINARVSATTNFTQTNLVSAAASCVKHLPPNLELGEKDRVAIIQSVISSENISSSVVKMLTAFISQAELSLSWIDQSTDEIMSWNPTIVCGSVDFIQSLVSPPLGVEKLLYYHRLFALSRLKFSSFTTFKKYPALRLVFAHRSLKSRPYTNWNTVRASLCVQVVEELGYFNVAGPMIVSDVYDYRQFPESVTRQISACGTVVQANEAKLVNYNGVDPGDLCIRGYNIGKATTTMANVGEKVIRPDSNGFYTFPVEARWGTDGCLYIMSS